MTAGKLIISVEVPGAPAPWTAQNRRADRTMSRLRQEAWQDVVRGYARVAMAGRPAIEGPVKLRFAFYVPKGWRGDLTNTVKAAEDALQGPGLVLLNDRQTVYIEAAKHTARDGVGLTVIWAEVVDSPALPEA